MSHKWWQFWRRCELEYKVALPIQVFTDTDPGVRIAELQKLLGEMHAAYRECMTRLGPMAGVTRQPDLAPWYEFQAVFYEPALKTAKLLKIPLWDRMTLPAGVKRFIPR